MARVGNTERVEKRQILARCANDREWREKADTATAFFPAENGGETRIARQGGHSLK